MQNSTRQMDFSFHQKYSIRNLYCRCIFEFNRIYEYPLFMFFTWNMMALSSELVTLQFQFVEYTQFVHAIENHLNFFSTHYKVG